MEDIVACSLSVAAAALAGRAGDSLPVSTFVDTGISDALYTAISPLQGGSDLVTFFIAVDDVDSAVNRARELGGRVIQEPQHVPGVSFALIADPQGHIVGLTHQG